MSAFEQRSPYLKHDAVIFEHALSKIQLFREAFIIFIRLSPHSKSNLDDCFIMGHSRFTHVLKITVKYKVTLIMHCRFEKVYIFVQIGPRFELKSKV